MKIYDLVIIGAGPAGMTAAIYAARAALDYVVLEASSVSGGQVLTTSDVDNYPGFPMIGGWELAEKMRAHAEGLNSVFETKTVSSVEDLGETKRVCCEDGTEYVTRAVLAAMGAQAGKLEVLGEDKYKGRGVSYCATCDGNFYKGKTVAVVGGGDTAMEDALYLSRLCNRVYVIHRRERFRAAAGLVKKIQSQKNIECIMKSRVREITGGLTVNGVLLETPEGERNLPVEGVFIAVGVRPKTELLKGLVEMDEAGYVIAGENCVTNCTGVFAAGDIRKKPLRQIVTAVADGANSVGSVVSYLE